MRIQFRNISQGQYLNINTFKFKYKQQQQQQKWNQLRTLNTHSNKKKKSQKKNNNNNNLQHSYFITRLSLCIYNPDYIIILYKTKTNPKI